ncbi:hypothetical protein ABMZ99_17875, partial [Pseudomonas aeruginosa]|uniref:hypothetical protein n=1 Tax=Pseudomonas aeruginosa TaxID=287 RepID=UPI0039BE7933
MADDVCVPTGQSDAVRSMAGRAATSSLTGARRARGGGGGGGGGGGWVGGGGGGVGQAVVGDLGALGVDGDIGLQGAP